MGSNFKWLITYSKLCSAANIMLTCLLYIWRCFEGMISKLLFIILKVMYKLSLLRRFCYHHYNRKAVLPVKYGSSLTEIHTYFYSVPQRLELKYIFAVYPRCNEICDFIRIKMNDGGHYSRLDPIIYLSVVTQPP